MPAAVLHNTICAMAIKPVPHEALEKIRVALQLESFARPWAALIDPGDLGTVFTYLPISDNEYLRLPPDLQAFAYRIGKGRYGLIGFVPRTFETHREGKVVAIRACYNEFGSITSMSYHLDTDQKEYFVEHTIRRDMLFKIGKTRKIPISTSVKSGA